MWKISYAALLHYCTTHGHCNVPQKDSYECVLPGMADDGTDYNFSGGLGHWLHNQQTMKKGEHGSNLSPDRERLLQQLVDEGMLL